MGARSEVEMRPWMKQEPEPGQLKARQRHKCAFAIHQSERDDELKFIGSCLHGLCTLHEDALAESMYFIKLPGARRVVKISWGRKVYW
jgi:hypothetical protein